MALSSFADGHLWGARYGRGPATVLALHGWERTHADFGPVLAGFDAVALDLPGFGVAPEPAEPWSTFRYAQDVTAVLAEMAPGPLVVLGHSFGARVAAHLAAAHPQRVRALVLTGAPLAPFPGTAAARPALAYRVARSLHRGHLLPEARMEALRRKYGSEDYRRASPIMRGVLVKAVSETAQAAYAPVLSAWAGSGGYLALVWGADDRVASLEGSRACLEAAGAAVAELSVSAGSAHLLGTPLHEALRAALERALGRVAPVQGAAG